MEQIIYCRDLGFDCNAVIRSSSEEEMLTQVGAHAHNDHDVSVITPELVDQVKAARRMSVGRTQAVMDRYFNATHDDVSMMATEVVFTDMNTGETYVGPEAVLAMLDYFYRQAFDARAEITNVIYGEGTAALEVDFVGQHIGDFAGIPATGKKVRVPLCVTYDLKDDKITRGRIFLQMPVMMQQLGIDKAGNQ